MGHAWEERDVAVGAASAEEVWAAIATGPGIDSSSVAPLRVRSARLVGCGGRPVAVGRGAWLRRRPGLAGGDEPAVGDRVGLTVPGVRRLDGVVDFVNSQALGIRAADGLYRFIQGY